MFKNKNLNPKTREQPLFSKKDKRKRYVCSKKGYSRFISILSSNSVLPSRILLYNGINFSFFLFLGLIRENLGVNLFKVQVREVHNQAMMLHCPSSQKLKTFKVLNELKIRKLL